MLRVSNSAPDAPRSRGSDRAEGPGRDTELCASVTAAIDRHVAVACADEHGRITFANRAFCRLSGYTREELLGQDHRLLDSGYHPQEFFAEVCQAVERGGTWTGEIKHRGKDGVDYWAAATVAPLAPAPQPTGRYVCICTDITQAKRAALQELEQQQELLRQADEQYAYAASHDLQEPLRAIVGCGQMLQECAPQVDPTVNELITHTIEGGKRMQRLVSALLAYARVGTHRPRLVRVSAEDAVARAMAPLSALLTETGAEVDAQGLPVVLADPQQLVELFRHLLGNALAYRGSERPTVWVKAALDGAFWRFSVADNGTGIDPAAHRRVFMLFSRLLARHEHPHHGVGLAVCKKIVERHGGRLWVESERGRGATFFFTLPARLTPALDQCE